MMNIIEDPQRLYTMLMDLVQQRLVNIRFNEDRTLVMFKYTKQVFFKNLWHVSPALLEARGIVFTNPATTGMTRIVTLPFRKVFNIGENGVELDMDAEYDYYLKLNGFMASLSTNPINNTLLITTTGSFDSPYVKMAEEKMELLNGQPASLPQSGTELYEIVHEDDPHIVHETPGAHFLAWRGVGRGVQRNNQTLKLGTATGAEIMKLGDETQTEGFMIYGKNGFAAKLKSRYYRTRKFAMRVKGDKLKLVWDNPSKAKLAYSDEEFWPMFALLREKMSFEEYNALAEQERRAVIDSLGITALKG